MLLVIETITWKPHVETAMEVALERHAAGEEVVYCNLRAGLPACEDDSASHALIDLPETRLRRAAALLREQGIRVERPAWSPQERTQARATAAAMMRSVSSDEELKTLRYGDFADIGWGVLSSVVSVTRNSTVGVRSHRRLLRRYLESSILVYDRVRALIEEYRPTQVLFFNGRFATTRAVMRAAESTGTPWLIHERGGDRNRYALSDCLPHDMARIQDKILAGWREDQAADGRAFFQSRRNRVETTWHSFTREQQVGRLPAEMAGEGEWVAFFTSSEDEMQSIGDFNANIHYPTQMDAIEAVAEAVRQMPGVRMCVRVHPHTSIKSRADREKWARLRLPGVVVIGPGDPVDTYALIDRARVVCTYGSTVGVEATYWGRPSLLFGHSFYERLGVCEIATGPEQVLNFLRSPHTFPVERTLPYGAYWERLGQPYRFYRADNLHRGSILGVYLDDSTPVRVAKRLMRPAKRLFGRG
jgi:hypothetical protein